MRRPLTRSPHHRSPLAVLAVVVTSLALVGCSGESDEVITGGAQSEPTSQEQTSSQSAHTEGTDPAQVLQDAVTETLELQAFTIDSDLDLQIAGQDLSLESEGSVDYSTPVGDIMLGVSQGGAENSVRVLADGESFWVDIEGPQAPEFPDGATWLQGDASRLLESTTFTPIGLLGAVLVLRGADDVTEIDTDEIDGVPVTRYESTFTYDDASAAVSGAEAESLEEAFALTGEASALPLDVEVVVGADGVLREIDLDLVPDGAPASGGYDLELSDVGEEIETPDPPDAEDVASGPEAEALLDQILT